MDAAHGDRCDRQTGVTKVRAAPLGCIQVMGVDVAIRKAAAAGYDWLIHIDVDELWYSPDASGTPQQAAHFFESVHRSIDEVAPL